jgi:hypothetical protein
MLPDIKTALIALAVGLLVGALGSWYLTAEYKDAKWGKAVADQKVEAGKILQAETNKVLAADRKATELNNQLEKNHADASKKIDSTLADNRRLSRELGGLRDPGRRPSCGGTQAGGNAPADAAGSASTGQLSAEASDFLLEFAADADRVAEYAQTCYSWAQGAAGLRK